jgi:putative hemolysin
MGKSKVRGGAKAHRKRVENRNQNIKTQQSTIQKLFSETMKLQMEEFKKKQESEQDGISDSQQ